MKVVLDTNVLVAAFATEGLCHALFELCVDQHQVFLSPFVVNELSNVLRKKLKVSEQVVGETTEYLEDIATIIEPKPLEKPVCRDTKDDALLALSGEADAEYLITGDDDLLILGKYQTTLIITPRNFWEISRQ